MAVPNTSTLSTTGNILVVTINNTMCGYIQNLTSNEDYNPEALSGVGDIHAVEYAPTFARYVLSVDRMLLRNSSLQTVAGGAPDNQVGAQGSGSGVVNGNGIWENGYQVMQGFIFDIVAMGGAYQIPNQRLTNNSLNSLGSSTGGNILKKWYNCSFANGQVTIQKHQIVVERASFFCTQIDGMNTIV